MYGKNKADRKASRLAKKAPDGTTIQRNSSGNEVSVMPGYDVNGNPIVDQEFKFEDRESFY